MVEIVWKEPPPMTTGKNAAILAELKKHPGRWALVNDSASSTSAPAVWKKLGCEAVHRRDETSTDKVRYHVYARWPEDPAAPKIAELRKRLQDEREAMQSPVQQERPNGNKPRPTDDKGLNRFLENRDKRGAHPDGIHFPGDPK